MTIKTSKTPAGHVLSMPVQITHVHMQQKKSLMLDTTQMWKLWEILVNTVLWMRGEVVSTGLLPGLVSRRQIYLKPQPVVFRGPNLNARPTAGIPLGPVNVPFNRWFLEGRHTLTASALSNYPKLLIIELQLCKPEAALVRRSPGWRSTKKDSNHLIWGFKIAQWKTATTSVS